MTTRPGQEFSQARGMPLVRTCGRYRRRNAGGAALVLSGLSRTGGDYGAGSEVKAWS